MHRLDLLFAGMVKFYGVKAGRTPGVYKTWAECQAQTVGFSRAVFRSFSSLPEAASFVADSEPMTGAIAQATAVPAPAESLPVSRSAYSTTCKGPPPSPASCFLVTFDGGARGNPGPGASAGLLWSPMGHSSTGSRTLLAECAAYAPHITCNQAEYGGLIEGLRLAMSAGASQLLVEGDSMLVVNQVTGKWRVNDATLQVRTPGLS
jgi:hypothetical protein